MKFYKFRIKNLLLEALDEHVHFNTSYIGKIERAKMTQTLPTILNLLEVINIDFETLFCYFDYFFLYSNNFISYFCHFNI